jgi:delta 1-pyrroline-5-carboxylate dehydrogenase
VTCISPWNFPLAIFTGQVAAALAAGNVVLAKPAEQTPLIAHRAVQLFHEAGVPAGALQLLPGRGETVGAALTADARVKGVIFTGSTEVAQLINRTWPSAPRAEGCDIPLIAETGGQNAMIVDSSALPEQVVQDVLSSAFDSAGQRCSALRVLFLQEDIADKTIKMLKGAMQELRVGVPDRLATDIGPVIDPKRSKTCWPTSSAEGHAPSITSRWSCRPLEAQGTFVPPTVLEIGSMAELSAKSSARCCTSCATAAPTWQGGRHHQRHRLRPDAGRALAHRRNHRFHHLARPRRQHLREPQHRRRRGRRAAVRRRRQIRHRSEGRRSALPEAPARGSVVCVADTLAGLLNQIAAVLATGNIALVAEDSSKLLPGDLPAVVKDRVQVVGSLGDFAGDFQIALVETMRVAGLRASLAARSGALVGLIDTNEDGAIPLWRLLAERALCVNTTAAGGNASLMTLEA